MDSAASAKLTRFDSPWTIHDTHHLCQLEDTKQQVKAVVWLSLKLKKSIFKLTAEDYEKNGLYHLLDLYHLKADAINKFVVDRLMKVITHYPAGEQLNDPPFIQKKVLIFSPHPDDDVICMAGTMQKLVQ